MKPNPYQMQVMQALRQDKAEKQEAAEKARLADPNRPKDSDRDQLGIVRRPDGSLYARCSAGKKVWTHELPSSFMTWDREEQAAHLRRFVVPWLKSKAEEWRRHPEFTDGKDDEPELVVEHKASEDAAQRRLAAAEAKRAERRLKKLQLVETQGDIDAD